MNGLIEQLSIDKTIWWSTLLSVFFLTVALLLVLIFYQNLPPFIPLFNQLPWGIDRLSPKTNLLFPIILTFVLLLCNTTLTKYIYERMVITSRMLAITSLLASLLTLIFTARIIQIIL